MVGVLLAWGVLSFGAVYPWGYAPLLALAVMTGLAAGFTAIPSPAPRAVIVAAVTTLLALLIQLPPLPSALLQRVSPSADRILRESHLAYSMAQPASHSISLAPGLTWLGAILLVALSVFTLGLARWLTRKRVQQIAVAATCIGIAVAFEAIVQQAVSPGWVYGRWRSIFGGDPFGPFFNKNHFAGWMAMMLPLALGLALGQLAHLESRGSGVWVAVKNSSRTVAGSMLALFGALVMFVSLLLSLSRSGAASAIVALGVAAVVAGPRRTLLVRLIALSSAAVIAVSFVGPEIIFDRFENLGQGHFDIRIGIWRDTWHMIRDFAVTGVGLGAFNTAILHYQTVLPDLHVNAAHNDWLQLAAEGGLLVGIPAAVLLIALVREAWSRFRVHQLNRDTGRTYWVRVGAATGILAMALQSTVEFSLRMPGNTILFAVLWAMVIAPVTPRERMQPA
jgi:O-antigen ligase